ncbi:hypothetical protein E2C01_088449 [Portunus trituberculatus]|uniref:Uncharacterized protein n=1 Tax=Portunus trituberculatus TaxID=210409 RepID=A0A5B7JFF5_PORTR|nr:hypothetical protein [Portunus trituberculatus]
MTRLDSYEKSKYTGEVWSLLALFLYRSRHSYPSQHLYLIQQHKATVASQFP